MAKRGATKRTKRGSTTRKAVADKSRRHCASPEKPERLFDASVTPGRARLIRRFDSKWANGTVLRYCFLQKPTKWRGTAAEKRVVRKGFRTWKDVGIGLDFVEVDEPGEAEVKIGFQRGDGAWSYLGRDVLDYGPHQRTMNFGWSIAHEPDTALHEIGHTLGFPHEHQNPNAGIVWNEEEVYRHFKESDDWDREETHYQVIRKIDPDDVQGSKWDPSSIMHYAFEAELIDKPAPYNRKGVPWPTALSGRDKKWAKDFYPPLGAADYKPLRAFESVRLQLEPGGQANFRVDPAATRKYQIRTFGPSDGVLVLFEEVDDHLRYLSGDDDSGTDANAGVEAKLFAGRRYVVRLRIYHRRAGDFGLMMW